MVVYELQCDVNHRFEGWFGNSADFDQQLASGDLICPVCGSRQLRKLPSAAYLMSAGSSAGEKVGPIAEQGKVEETLRQLAEYVRSNYENLGPKFPEEARRIHYGEVPARNIRGTATGGEVRELLEEGIAVVPVPNVDNDKLN